MSTKILIENVRLSYEHVWEASAIAGSNSGPKFSVVALIPATDTAMIARVQEAINAAYQEGIPKKWGGKAPATLKNPLVNGDTKDLEKNPEYGGHFYVSASNDRQPMIVGRDKQPITDRSLVYSGAICNVLVNFFPYKNVSTGIGCSLLGVQFVAHGEAFASNVSTDDFAALEAPAPATAAFPTLPPNGFGNVPF